jgi:hypothetical protein
MVGYRLLSGEVKGLHRIGIQLLDETGVLRD